MTERYERQATVIRRDLLDLRNKHKVVSKAQSQIGDPRWMRAAADADKADMEVTIGVTFRIDGGGSAHSGHDVKGLKAINNLQDPPPCRVKVVPLPKGARGAKIPARNASYEDLDGIDLLYIPGAPAAPGNQVATSADPVRAAEERNFNVKTAPAGPRPPSTDPEARKTYDRARDAFRESLSRPPYELRLIEIARTRGIPVLAICAGSWRLLESYGGKVRTMPIEQRGKHKADNRDDTWNISHPVRVSSTPGGMLRSTAPETLGERPGTRLLNEVNTTHWAAACIRYVAKRKEFGLAPMDPNGADPDTLLEIAAMADDPLAATVEAFESRYGAPTIGIQWHPESYLPGMLGENQGSAEGRAQAAELFRFVVSAAMAAKSRRVGIAMVLRGENEAFGFIRESAKALARGDDRRSKDLLSLALNKLPRAKWSLRMEKVASAVKKLEAWKRMSEKGNPNAGNLLNLARRELAEVGVPI